LNLQNSIHARTAHKHCVCVCVCFSHTHTHTQGLCFLAGSFQCGWRTADVANYPTDGEREDEKKRKGEREKEGSGGGGEGVIKQ